MTRLLLTSLALAISISPSYGQNSILHTDRFGYTTGIDGGSTEAGSVVSTRALTATATVGRGVQSATKA